MALEINCSGCGAVNRVPADRLDDAPKCGRCGQPLEPKVSAEDGQKIEALFGQLFTAMPEATPGSPSVAPEAQPEEAKVAGDSALYSALRRVGFDQSDESIGGRGQRLRAGLWGLLLGGPITAAGTFAGTLLMNGLLRLMGARGSIVLPNVVLAAAYVGAIYGFMVTVTGTVRLISALAPETHASSSIVRLIRLVLLVLVGFSLLIGIWAVVHHYRLADFSL